MYNYCNIIGVLKEVKENSKSLVLELTREFRNANGEFEKYQIETYIGNLYDFTKDYLEESIGKKIVIKGRIEPQEDGKCILIGERIMGMQD